MLRTHLLLIGMLLSASLARLSHAETIPYADSKIGPATPQWLEVVARNAPERPTVAAPKRKLLVFSLHTGYYHEVIPYVDQVFRILGRCSGAFDVMVSRDIEALAEGHLAPFDVLVLNNNCSKGPRRNLLLDQLESSPKYSQMTAEQRQEKANTLEESMLEFVTGGGGLVVVHGAPTILNQSARFTTMVGAAFDYHPPNQSVTIRPVDTDHPLVAAFRNRGPLVHRDEPYCFKGPYEKLDFRPLLAMDVDQIEDPRGRVGEMVRYVSWIKPHGKGRVFYCSPSHFPASYQSPTNNHRLLT